MLHKDVREVATWPSSLISEWLAYDQIEPLPDSWYQTGLICSILANSWGKKKTRPEDWIPRVKSARKRQSMEAQRAIIESAVVVAEMRRRRQV